MGGNERPQGPAVAGCNTAAHGQYIKNGLRQLPAVEQAMGAQLQQVADLRLVGDDGIERAGAPDGQVSVRCQALDDDILSGQPAAGEQPVKHQGAQCRRFGTDAFAAQLRRVADIRTADDGIRAGRRVEDEHCLKRDALAADEQHFIQRQCRGVDAAIDQCRHRAGC